MKMESEPTRYEGWKNTGVGVDCDISCLFSHTQLRIGFSMPDDRPLLFHLKF